jgi:hypothetical protein
MPPRGQHVPICLTGMYLPIFSCLILLAWNKIARGITARYGGSGRRRRSHEAFASSVAWSIAQSVCVILGYAGKGWEPMRLQSHRGTAGRREKDAWRRRIIAMGK